MQEAFEKMGLGGFGAASASKACGFNISFNPSTTHLTDHVHNQTYTHTHLHTYAGMHACISTLRHTPAQLKET